MIYAQRRNRQEVIVIKLKKFSQEDEKFLSKLFNFNIKTNSGQFPDFMFPIRFADEEFQDGNILELKDTKESAIASFNSTMPSKIKTLGEIAAFVYKMSRILDYPYSNKDYNYDYKRTIIKMNTKRLD